MDSGNTRVGGRVDEGKSITARTVGTGLRNCESGGDGYGSVSGIAAAKEGAKTSGGSKGLRGGNGGTAIEGRVGEVHLRWRTDWTHWREGYGGGDCIEMGGGVCVREERGGYLPTW